MYVYGAGGGVCKKKGGGVSKKMEQVEEYVCKKMEQVEEYVCIYIQ